MRQTLMTAFFACASMLVAAPEKAEAQVMFRPWLRPRVVFMPRPWVRPISVPQVVVQPAPPVYYPPPYYYPPPTVYVQPPAPPQVYVQPAPPPPVYVQPPAPVYVQPPAPVYVQPPAPVYVQPPVAELPQPPVMQAPPVYQAPPPPPPVYQAPPPPVYQPRPVFTPPVSQWGAKWGFGARFAAAISTDGNTQFSQLGFGGELLGRVHRRVVLELAGEYQKRVDNGFERYDVPITLGMRVHIGAPDWVVSPYFVFAGGAVYSNMDYLHSQDKAWFADGQLGGGLEIRIGKHLALTADVRGDFRRRMTDPDEATIATTSVNGKPFAPMANSAGLQGRLGAALYF